VRAGLRARSQAAIDELADAVCVLPHTHPRAFPGALRA
jgi:hypothetical protein